MKRLILILVYLLSAFLIMIDAQAKIISVCPVGESSASDGSICNDVVTGENNCAAYCAQTYSKELIKSSCSKERPDNNQRECICHLKCANGGTWGKGFWWSFDSTNIFGYRSIKKFYVFKPCKALRTLPKLEIHYTGRVWTAGALFFQAMDIVDLIIPDFDQTIKVATPTTAGQPLVITINNKVVAVPYKFFRFNKHREEFIDFAFITDVNNRLNLVITTNFGFGIAINAYATGHRPGPSAMLSDMTVFIPRHPELKGNTCGILSSWDDNPANDAIDANGISQTLEVMNSRAYGDSWIVPDAQANVEPLCLVGEPSGSVGNICNEDDADARNKNCVDYCTKTYGKELIKSTCSKERPDNNQRECICHLKCANGGCWAGSHCHSFDSTRFGFSTLKKVYIFKPCKAFPTLPNFEIRQTNRKWGVLQCECGTMLDNVDIIVPSFGQAINVLAPKVVPKPNEQPFVVTINKTPVTVPFRFSRFDKHREEFIDFISINDGDQLKLFITTSFGVRILLSAHPTTAPEPNVFIYSDIEVFIPRHPEMRSNTCGIYGLWDENPTNDNKDPNGNPQTLDQNWSKAFVESWSAPVN